MDNLNEDSIHILLHEIGHTFALDGSFNPSLIPNSCQVYSVTKTLMTDYLVADFYDWTPTGVTNFVMNAGSSTVITEFDFWMMKDWWRHLKSRYGL
jgi:hypothetical protein